MDDTRWGALLAVLAVAALTAGCVGFLTGAEPLEFSANETLVGDAALEETGYQEADNRTFTQRFNASVAGQERQVTVTNHVYSYNRTLAVEPGANASVETTSALRFVVASTPNARVAGQTLNPIAGLSAGQLIERFLPGDRANVRFEGNRSVRALGEQRTVSTYRTSPRANANRSALIHLATFEHEGDVIVAAALHPRRIDEQARIDALIAGLEQHAE